MEQLINPWAIPVAALTALVIGFVWYNPKIFGNVWMKASGMTEEKMKGGNMAVIFGVSLALSLLLAFFTMFLVVHVVGVYGMTEGQLDGPTAKAFMDEWAGKYRSFGHGLIHGAMAGVFMVLPIVAINALFERKSWKYILINAGYWIVTLAIMGSIISGWVK